MVHLTFSSPRYMKTKIFLFLTILPLFLCLACGKKVFIPVTPHPGIPTMLPSDVRQQAERAWQAGDYRASQRLYARLANDPTVPSPQRAFIWQRLTLSAIQTKDMAQAAAALTTWTQLEPEARTTGIWNIAQATVLKDREGNPAFEHFLTAILEDQNLPLETKTEAATALILHYREQNNEISALHVYRALYSLTPTTGKKKALETRLQKELQSLPLQDLATAVDSTTLGAMTTFPKNVLIAVYDIRQLNQDDTLWGQVWQDLHALLEKGEWAGTFPFAKELNELTKKYGHPTRHIALLIPLQGPYKSIGWRIARGVGAAQWSLSRQGMELNVTLINAANPSWVQEVNNLPSTCQIIGGPLQKTTWETATANGLDKQRAFLTFMPSLNNEGRQAWRFFGSPRDQVRTVISAAVANNISRFAILYPQEPYGTKMAQYFWEEATQQGGEIMAMSSYTPKQPTLWGKKIASFLKAENLKKGDLNPEPDFKAVFLPDSMDNAQLIVPQFFFYNENRLMFLGTQLWGQETERLKHLETRYFDLAVFPGAWWKDNPAPSVTALKAILQDNGQKEADFWVALGYDFTRFAARMVVPSRTTSNTAMNTSLAAPQAFDWAMAPITWDKEGLASQHYFTFQPTSNGPRVASQERAASIIAARETRRQTQSNALDTTKSDTLPLLEDNAPTDSDSIPLQRQPGLRRAVTTPAGN